MTPDELRLEETRAWMIRARSDLRAARLLISGNANAEALFHCQQAVEKALKGYLTFHQRTFRKTHDLGDLSPDCLALDGGLGPVLDQIEGLTQYAWRFRYPEHRRIRTKKSQTGSLKRRRPWLRKSSDAWDFSIVS